ncbi:MAG: D-tyrosyl-tRNA(Tyr) deacylase [Lachnospiraceae bacterium]|jgi:D-tyrosyl-tRNA(Tyr) deacylase|nr:D-tyrosyl-tRNA(Tyr) deacylase [Lachnospiraceae bacterium]
MKFLIQRVKQASVSTEAQTIGKIGKGFLVFIGVSQEDTQEIADKMIRKLLGMRIFEDENGKTNLSLADVSGQLLLISQFTLYADCKKGNRPSFIKAGNPELAENLYEYIVSECKKKIPIVQTGSFGANMEVTLLNDGPFTIILDSSEIF